MQPYFIAVVVATRQGRRLSDVNVALMAIAATGALAIIAGCSCCVVDAAAGIQRLHIGIPGIRLARWDRHNDAQVRRHHTRIPWVVQRCDHILRPVVGETRDIVCR